MGSAAGRNFLAPGYYGQRAVFASLRALFSIQSYLSGRSQYVRRGPTRSSVTYSMWAAGFRVRADTIRALHRGADVADRQLRFVAPSLRRRHAGLRLVSASRC